MKWRMRGAVRNSSLYEWQVCGDVKQISSPAVSYGWAVFNVLA